MLLAQTAAQHRDFMWPDLRCRMVSTSPRRGESCFIACAVSTKQETAALCPISLLQHSPLMRKAPTNTLAGNHYRICSTSIKHRDRRTPVFQQNNCCDLNLLAHVLKHRENRHWDFSASHRPPPPRRQRCAHRGLGDISRQLQG